VVGASGGLLLRLAGGWVGGWLVRLGWVADVRVQCWSCGVVLQQQKVMQPFLPSKKSARLTDQLRVSSDSL
jgi:hypothetical protein